MATVRLADVLCSEKHEAILSGRHAGHAPTLRRQSRDRLSEVSTTTVSLAHTGVLWSKGGCAVVRRFQATESISSSWLDIRRPPSRRQRAFRNSEAGSTSTRPDTSSACAREEPGNQTGPKSVRQERRAPVPHCINRHADCDSPLCRGRLSYGWNRSVSSSRVVPTVVAHNLANPQCGTRPTYWL
jgi:hypothetical protein